MTDRAERLYQSAERWLSAVRHNENFWRLRSGLRVARTERAYGMGAVRRLALATHVSRSSLYEYQAVWCFCYRWLGWSARRTFSERPTLDYSHLRIVIREFEDFEDQVDAVLWALDLGYTPDEFGLEIARWKGATVPPVPLFDERGTGEEVVSAFLRQMQATPNWRRRRVRVIVREVK